MRYDRSWVELFFILCLLIGLVVSLSASSALINYVIIILFGVLSGRLLFVRRGLFKFTYIVIILGFFIGYIFGSYKGNSIIITILFVLANIVSYYAHKKKYI